MSTSWMAYGCLACLPAQGCCRLRSLGALALCHLSPDCKKVHKRLPNLLVHLLQLSRSNHLVQPECPALMFDQLETGVPCRTHQRHCHHIYMLVHIVYFWEICVFVFIEYGNEVSFGKGIYMSKKVKLLITRNNKHVIIKKFAHIFSDIKYYSISPNFENEQ